MKDSSTEPQTDTVDTQQRRRRRTRALLALVLIVGPFGVALRPRLNATERKLVGVWDGTEAAAGSRFRFDASRRYRIESSVGPNVLYVQEGEWRVHEGQLSLFDDRKIPGAYLSRLVWRVHQSFRPRGVTSGTLEFVDDRTFRSTLFNDGVCKRGE